MALHSSPVAPLGRADAGGMNLYVRRLATGLADRGVATDIFTRRTDGIMPPVVELAPGVRIISLAAGPRRRLPKSTLPLHVPSLVSAMNAFVKNERIDYDVLHSHYWLSGIVAMRYRRQCGESIPLIHMFHTLVKLKEHYMGEVDRDESDLRFDGERCLIGRADTVVGATAGEAEEMALLYGRSPQQYEVIPPGVDLDLFVPHDKRESRRALGLAARYVILFVGRQDKLKGLDVLLRSIGGLPAGLRQQLRVVLVGGRDGRDGEGQRTRKLVTKLGLDEIVEFRGKVDQSDLPRYYSAADVCAMPSAYESFGMVAIESMACQTPVVAFRVGGLATTINDGKTGFLVPRRDEDGYRKALYAALTSSKPESMGRRARLEAQKYSWDRTVDQTLALYEELVAEQRESLQPRYAAH